MLLLFYWRAQKVLAQVDIWNVYSAAVIADNGKMCYRFDHDVDLPYERELSELVYAIRKLWDECPPTREGLFDESGEALTNVNQGETIIATFGILTDYNDFIVGTVEKLERVI